MWVKAPKGWNEVTIKQLQELSEVDKTGVQGAVERLAILCDVDPEDLRKGDLNVLGQLAEQVLWAEHLPTEAGYKNRFELDGKKFGLINLDKVTLGEWVDLEQLINDGAQKNLHKILAILYREIYREEPTIDLIAIEKYDTEKSAVNANLFQNSLDVQTVYGACLFFSLFGSGLALNTVSSLNQELKRMTTGT